MTRCSRCNRKKGCPGYDWYAPSDIKFCRNQMLWILSQLDMFIDGYYPPDPRPSGYIGGHAPRIVARASFEIPNQLAAETEIRLNQTGVDGKLLKAEVKLGMDYRDLSQEARTALNYISGYSRKETPYPDWVRVREYRQHFDTPSVSFSLPS